MSIPLLAELTFEEVQALDPPRTVAILPVGAIEAHGPHLPLDTDVVIALAMARRGAAILAERGRAAVLLPPLTYTPAPFASAFTGTVSIAPATLTALVLELATELTRHGFAALAIANSHLDPVHRAALADAVTRAAACGALPVAFPDLTRKPWALRLGEEFRSGACHAGRFEGSIVMAERPAAVREAVRVSLPPNPASLSDAIRAGATDFAAAGGPRAYFGWPAEASATEGRESIEALGAILADAVNELPRRPA